MWSAGTPALGPAGAHEVIGRNLAIMAVLAFALSGCGTSVPSVSAPFTGQVTRSPSAARSIDRSPMPSAATSGPSLSPKPVTVVATISYGVAVGQGVNASSTAVGFGSIWVPIYASPHGWLIRIEPATHRVIARIPVGESPDSVAISGGSVWVGNTIGDGSRPFAGQNTLSRIDPNTNRVVGTIRVEVGGPIVGGFGAVWVMGFESRNGKSILRKIDARSGRTLAVWALSGQPRVGCDSLWMLDVVTDASAPAVTTVSRIDPLSGRRTAQWTLPAAAAEFPVEVPGGCYAVWNQEGPPARGVIAKIDPDHGVRRASDLLPTLVRVISGRFWSMSVDGVGQPLSEDGTPTGPAIALPPDSMGTGDWMLLSIGGSYYVVAEQGVVVVVPER